MEQHLLKQITAVLLSVISIASFSQNKVTITNCNLNGWVKQIPANTSLTFENEPANPILGKGSLEMITVPVQRNVRLRNTNYNNTLLSSITELSFSSFIAHRENNYDAPFVVLQVDLNGDGTTDNFLEFGPQYQTAPWSTGVASDQGTVITDSWQTWDILHGVFWLGPDIDPEHGGTVFNLAAYISQHPGAKIINDPAIGGGIRLSAGGFAPNFKCYTDNFKIGVNGITTIYDFEYTTANAGADKDVVYGYGSNCITLNGVAAGGVAPYSYSWLPGGSLPNNSSAEVCPTTTTTYTLRVTDATGCSRSDDVTISVNDVRCGSKMDKVRICHNDEEICVAKESVEAHLKHGDALGSCRSSFITSAARLPEATITEKIRFSAAPNPFATTTRLEYQLPFEATVSIQVYDGNGKEVKRISQGYKGAGRYSLSLTVPGIRQGIYYCRLIATGKTGVSTETIKMILIN